MTTEESPLFENLTFDPFNFESILLNNNQDPDKNLYGSFQNSSFYTPNELSTLLENVPKKNTSFSIISFNIRSMKKNFEEFKNFISNFNYEFSIISLTETWCLDDQRNESIFKLKNYKSIHQARNGDRNGGGTCLFIHNSLTFNKRSDLCVNNNDIESLSVEILNANSKNIIVNVTYRQSAGDIKVFEDSFKKLLSPKKHTNKPIYLTGDFNLNLLDYNTNAKVKSYLNIMFARSFVPLINKPTRISKNNSTIIDHILTNAFINVNYVTGIVKTDISDHFPVFVITETDVSKTQKSNFTFKRNINDLNLREFNEKLLSVDWTSVFQNTDPNTAYDDLKKKILLHYETCFPKKKVQIKLKNILSPWITRGIIKSSKRKQKLYEKFLKQRTPRSELLYKDYKRLFETIKQKSKSNYFNKQLCKYQNNVKKTWDVIKEVIGTTKSNSHSLPKRLVVNNVEIIDKNKIAKHFNKYFANVGPNLASKISKSNNKNFESFLSGNYPTLQETALTVEELKNAFIVLKSNKSSGFDDISSEVIKYVFDALVEPIMYIFDLSIKKGVFPDKLKIARITPIFKSGKEEIISNYRPISVLSCFSKILERIMYNRLYSFLIENNILYDKQFGFQKEHSTEHAILQLTNQILQSFNQDKYTIGVFIDLSKAFDTVDHNILLKKLSFYGVRNNTFKWFKSYLSNRKQYITTDQGNTEMENITCGVPQGSILGPLLFLIFVNDLSQATSLDPIMFADDTNLFYSNKNITTLFETVNEELVNINIWFCVNKLSLNASKTKYVFFHKSRQNSNIPLNLPMLKINQTEIMREKSLKFLGVMIDENLNWKSHIDLLVNKISKNIGVLYKASKILNIACLKNIYFALIHSYINYANIAWGSSYKTGLKDIFLKQKQAVRIIFNKDRLTHSRPLMKKLKVLNVYQLNLYHVSSFMYQVKKGTIPKIFNKNLSSVEHSYPTRFAINNFQLPRSSMTSKFSIILCGPKIWNQFLTDEEKNSPTLFSLKLTLKNKILDCNNELTFF